jgi:hypothetical protein
MRTVVPGFRAAAVAGSSVFAGSPCAKAATANKPVAKVAAKSLVRPIVIAVPSAESLR